MFDARSLGGPWKPGGQGEARVGRVADYPTISPIEVDSIMQIDEFAAGSLDSFMVSFLSSLDSWIWYLELDCYFTSILTGNISADPSSRKGGHWS